MRSLFPPASLRPLLRRLVHERSFTLTVLLTLGLCIGANVAIFAVVDAILVRSLPYPHADRLVVVRNSYPGAGAERSWASLANYYDRREHVAAFDSTSIHQEGSAIVGEEGAPQRLRRDRVSPEFFATLGVPLLMGRTFTEEEMLYANASVAILTHEFWKSHFGQDPQVLGQTFVVDGFTHTVIGVLPADFRFLDSKARFFVPLASNLDERGPDRRHNNNQQMIARLSSGVTLTEAQRQMDAFNEVQLQDDPYAQLLRDAGFRTRVLGLHDDTVRDIRPTLVLLQVGVLSLLLIGAVNLANLMLIRAHGRAKEQAVRQALGASRLQLAHETLMETVMLTFGGGVFGLLIGAVGIQLLGTLGTHQLPLGAQVQLDARVALISLAAAILTGLLLSIPIIGFNLRRNFASALQAETRGGTPSRAAQTLRHAFIVAQVALAFILLSAAGLLGLSMKNILATSPGFRADHVLTARLSLPWKNYPEPAPRLAFIERLLSDVRQLPGVLHAGVNDGMPFSGNASDNATAVEGVERAPGESIRTHYTMFVAGEYWQALGIPLIEGRFLDDGDQHREQRVAVIDQAFAERYWPGQSPLGRRIADDVNVTEENAITIVGVVGTVKQHDLTDTKPLGAVYLPHRIRSSPSFSLVIRSAMAPEALGSVLPRLVLGIDPSLPVDDIKVYQQRLDDSLVARRSSSFLAGIFAGLALLLSAVGTYGVLAYAVSQRRREIGVRMALGAQPGQVLRQFLGLGSRFLLLGLGLGALGAWGAGHAMHGLLFGLPPLHLGVLAGTAAIMILVVLIATLVPSQRAARVSPLEALRQD
jgi:predicted permease